MSNIAVRGKTKLERFRQQVSETLGIPLDQVPEPEESKTSIAAQIAATKRYSPDADTTELEKRLKAAKLEDYIRKSVDEAPPLTDEQIDKLTALLGSARTSND